MGMNGALFLYLKRTMGSGLAITLLKVRQPYSLKYPASH
jgi:hypothetical protein